jgi:hypothetical protein
MAGSRIKNPREHTSIQDMKPTHALPAYDPDEGEIGRRVVEIDGEDQFTLKSFDPHGWWKVYKSGKKNVPHELSGWYTTVKAAQLDINKWRNTQAEQSKE